MMFNLSYFRDGHDQCFPVHADSVALAAGSTASDLIRLIDYRLIDCDCIQSHDQTLALLSDDHGRVVAWFVGCYDNGFQWIFA